MNPAFEIASKSSEYGPFGLIFAAALLGAGAGAWLFLRPWVAQKLAHADEAFRRGEVRKDKDLEYKGVVADVLVQLKDGHRETLDVVLAIRAEQVDDREKTAALVAAARHHTEAFKTINEKFKGKLGIDGMIGGATEALHDAGDDSSMHPAYVPPPPASGRTRRPHS